ncbi:hypothetical protein M8J76_005529 [Diaphorina citri]|nr:hypothetical protein M8J76_005529 [Diaphorina citri]
MSYVHPQTAPVLTRFHFHVNVLQEVRWADFVRQFPTVLYLGLIARRKLKPNGKDEQNILTRSELDACQKPFLGELHKTGTPAWIGDIKYNVTCACDTQSCSLEE